MADIIVKVWSRTAISLTCNEVKTGIEEWALVSSDDPLKLRTWWRWGLRLGLFRWPNHEAKKGVPHFLWHLVELRLEVKTRCWSLLIVRISSKLLKVIITNDFMRACSSCRNLFCVNFFRVFQEILWIWLCKMRIYERMARYLPLDRASACT